MHRDCKFPKLQEKDYLPYVHGWWQATSKKWKTRGALNTDDKNIQPGYRNGIWHCKMHYALDEK